MKVRDSGMPEEAYWESLFDINLILSKLEINDKVNDLAEFGSGYGTFSIPASKIIKGTLYAIDMDPEMIERLYLRVKAENIKNIKIIEEDFVKERTILSDNSVDYVMLFNILHAEDPVQLLTESKRILRPGGKVGIIHWIYSKSTPRGPSLDIRPKPEQCVEWLKEAGFTLRSNIISLPPYHYGIVAQK